MKRSLSPKDLAAAIGVSESSLKRWADAGKIAVARTEGGHRRIPIAEAVRFIRESGSQIVRPEVLDLPEISAVASNDDGADDVLYQQLAAGNSREVRGMVMARYLQGASLASIFDGPIMHAMARIGELWQHDPRGVFIEHRATDTCLQAASQLRALFEPADDAAVAVGGAPSGDPYLLPSLLASTLLASEGLRPVNLGPDTPIASFRHAVAHYHPKMVWISVSTPAPPNLGDELAALARELASQDATLVIGGRRCHDVARQVRDACVVESMSELAAFARGLAAGRKASG